MGNKQPHALVIGASNFDIKGQTHSYHIDKTSNPGAVRNSAGGVARNIAENLARLGTKATLLSVVGNDLYGRQILETTRAAGVDLDHVKITDECGTGIFVAILNHYGDLVSAIADLDAISLITVDYLKENVQLFDDVSFVVIDADIPAESLKYCVAQCAERNIPICVEPVSVARAKQIVPYLSQLSMVTPNREEAEALVGFPLASAEDVKKAGKVLLDVGLKWVIITLGPEGVLYATEDEIEFLSSISTVVTDTVGAGDALTSGTISGLLEGLSLREAVKRGIACATLTLQTRLAVCPNINLDKVQSYIEKMA
ncbi:MAG: carbohydrate kinase family protein [bacterium]|nr:carbohydrate kinase family protein [bacterium]